MRIAVLAGVIGGARFLRGVRAAFPDDDVTLTGGQGLEGAVQIDAP